MEDDDEASIDDDASEQECAAEADIAAAEIIAEDDDPTKPWQGNTKYKTKSNPPTRLPSPSPVPQ